MLRLEDGAWREATEEELMVLPPGTDRLIALVKAKIAGEAGPG